LKDILNALYPLQAPPAETDAAVDGSAPPDGEESSAGTGSFVDNLETLPLVMEQQDWPPRPWIPKSSLLRWLSNRSSHVQDCKFESDPSFKGSR